MADIHDLDENTDPQPADEMYILDGAGATENDERIAYLTVMTLGALIGGKEWSANPTAPAEGHFIIFLSDGTGVGDDGDVMIASQAGGTTNYGTLFDHSAGTVWP